MSIEKIGRLNQSIFPSFSGVFGKHEMEAVAIRIVQACEEKKTWNCMFRVPSPNSHEDYHVGFTWLIRHGYLDPVPAASAFWIINNTFVKKIHSVHKSLLGDRVGKDHSLMVPNDRGTLDGPKFCEL